MDKKPTKYNYKSFKSDKVIGDAFELHCSKLGLQLKESVDIVFKFLVENNINPDDLDFIWQKRARTELNNAKSELMAIHNLSVGFLRTFELKQIAFWEQFNARQTLFQKNLIKNLELNYKQLGLQKSVIDELLYNTQMLLQVEDEAFGKKIATDNFKNIIHSEQELAKITSKEDKA